MVTFTVDTHLFRELGELLVGRDSTALVELIKNSYDADATEVVLYGEQLTNRQRGFISIRDNGTGMSRSDFESGFLRIAARTKEASDRRSPVFQRRYTGAKGIGRLAAHKLARSVEIASARWNGIISTRTKGSDAKLKANPHGLVATIDWDQIENQQTLSDVDQSNAIVVNEVMLSTGALAGTTIALRRLRRSWTPSEHGRFLEEIQAFEAPRVLVDPIRKGVLLQPLLFETPVARDVSKPQGATFRVRLEGDLAPPEDFWVAMIEAANWIIEIDANRASKTVRYAIAPTKSTRDELPDATSRFFEIPHPNPDNGPFFQARILKRVGVRRGDAELKEWAGRTSGVRVFVEGFRTLPYGEPRNDWLSLDSDAAQRDRGMLNKHSDERLERQYSRGEKDDGAGLLHLPNKHYVGGVFLTERNMATLKMLVNREGFVPDPSYQLLVDLVRKGIDLGTRVQAAATHEIRTERRALRAESKDARAAETTDAMPSAIALETTIRNAQAHAAQARQLVAGGNVAAASEEVQRAAAKIESIARASSEIVEESAMIRVLASVGTQLASFVHEIQGVLGIATAVEHALTALRQSTGLSPIHKRQLADLARSISDLKRTLERHASYLIDVVTPDSRRRRSRQQLSRRFDTSIRLVEFAVARRDIRITNRIPADLRSPPMFPAELTAMFSNLLSNAVKAAGHKGRIVATGRRARDGSVKIRIENTGARVALRNSERWFRPFESTTTDVDAVLGQGMGLGLPITRSMLEEYGATIEFVVPSAAFATAIEVTFPE